MEMSIAQRVANGVELLDAKVPDWRSKVETETLAILSLDQCVIGQVFGGWKVGVDQLGLTREMQESHGFELTPQEYYAEPVQVDDDLEHEWIKAINAGI